MAVPNVKPLKVLDDESGKLKTLLAEQMLDAGAMKELLAKMVGPVGKHKVVAHLVVTTLTGSKGSAQLT